MLDLTRYFLAPDLAVWFWLLVPFLLLYLIRPKPVSQTIPSLMFLLQDKAKSIRNSFLKYLYRDFVFFLQLLALALLIGAACEPFVNLPKTTLVSSTVIVLDASASMQTSDGRWEAALDTATSKLSRQNTIILVLNRPYVVASRVSRGDAEEILSRLEPADTETNLYAAIVASREYAEGPDSVVAVISDFRNTDRQQDYKAAIKTVQATGATVELHPVGGPAKNVGITSVVVEEHRTRIGITNFGEEATAVDFTAASIEQAVPLGPGSTDYVSFTTPPGVTTATIDADDDFDLDDRAYIVNNEDLDVSVLIITNNQDIRTTPFWYSLQAIDGATPLDFEISVSSPPALPSIDHDIVVFYEVNTQLLVQRTVRDTAAAVQSGRSAVVIMHQEDLFSIDFEGLFPYEYEGAGNGASVMAGEFTPLVKDVEFGEVTRYHRISGGGRVIAQTGDGTPIITLLPVGRSNVLYYGIDDESASFPQEASYSRFWKNALDELGGRIAPERLNYRTGAAPLFTGAPDEKPDGAAYNGFLDEQGVYTFGERSVAANLMSREESDVSAEPADTITAITGGRSEQSLKQKELATYMLLVVLALLFLELFIVKYRGDF
jgi:hypothetical protein